LHSIAKTTPTIPLSQDKLPILKPVVPEDEKPYKPSAEEIAATLAMFEVKKWK
jgi:hypothetical protein